MKSRIPNQLILTKLTYLWAFVEGGLGGMMHLLHIPLTGFVIGGFSIFINIFIAIYARGNIKWILNILGIVLITKFTLSPHSPIGAYIAVCFQGLFSIFVFQLFKINRWTILIYSISVMLESAIQKPLMGYLFFHKEISLSFEWLRSHIHFADTIYIIYSLIILYLSIYVIWGVLIGNWSYEFLYNSTQPQIIPEYQDKIIDTNQRPRVKFKNITYYFIGVLTLIWGGLIFTEFSPWIQDFLWKLIWYTVIFGVILPQILFRILSYYQRSKKSEILDIQNQFFRIKQNVILSFQMSKQLSGISKIKKFIYLSIYLNVFHEE